ncbi:MAG: hypothetical protein R2844_15805 [Caldilineales bacterium]
MYRGPYLERLPDLVVEADYPDMFKPHGAYHGTAAVRNLSTGEMRQRAITGCHRMNGVLIAWGPDVQPGSTVADPALIDVAPTMLHLLGQPVPTEMDGRVLTETLRGDRLGPVQTATLAELGSDGPGAEVGFSDDEAEYVRERLAGLGYLG